MLFAGGALESDSGQRRPGYTLGGATLPRYPGQGLLEDHRPSNRGRILKTLQYLKLTAV